MSDVLTSQRNEQIGDKKVAILEQLREEFLNVAEALDREYNRIKNLLITYERLDKNEREEQTQQNDNKTKCINEIQNAFTYIHNELNLLEKELIKNSESQNICLKSSTSKSFVLLTSIKEQLICMANNHSFMINSHQVHTSQEYGINFHIHQKSFVNQNSKELTIKSSLNLSKIYTLRELIESDSSEEPCINMPITNAIKFNNIKSITSECLNSIEYANELSSEYQESQSSYQVNRFTINSNKVNTSSDYLAKRSSLVTPLPSLANSKEIGGAEDKTKRKNIEDLIKLLRLSFKAKYNSNERESENTEFDPFVEIVDKVHSNNLRKNTPNTFKECLNIDCELMAGTDLASGYLSARSRSKLKQMKTKCFSNLSNFPPRNKELIPFSTNVVSVFGNKVPIKFGQENQLESCFNEQTSIKNFSDIYAIENKNKETKFLTEKNTNERKPIILGSKSRAKNDNTNGKIVKNNSKMKLTENR